MLQYQYLRPGSLDQALAMKAGGGPQARFVAGGTDVHVLRRAGRLEFSALISLRRLPELKGVRAEGDTIRIGAGCTLSELLQEPLVRRELPILCDALKVMGCTQMRNLATIGGNVMSAVSSGDTIPPLICLDARCLLVSAQGERRLPLDQFFTGPRQTAAREDELLLALELPRPKPDQGGACLKLGRRAALDLAVVNLAVMLERGRDGSIARARVAAGAVGPTPLRLRRTEEVLTGGRPGPELWQAAARAALGETQPWDDVRASRWYRREMIKVLLPRVIRAALERAEATP